MQIAAAIKTEPEPDTGPDTGPASATNTGHGISTSAENTQENTPIAPPLRPLDPEMMEMLELFTYTQQKINDHLEKVFAADNLSLAHYRALFFVLRYPGITVSGLIDKLDITKQSLARVLADLMRGKPADAASDQKKDELINSDDGYLRSEVDAHDRRARCLFLTTKGEKLMLWALNPVTEAMRRTFGSNSDRISKE